jgi:hypothetical protein
VPIGKKNRNRTPAFASRLRDFADAVLDIWCKGMGNFVRQVDAIHLGDHLDRLFREQTHQRDYAN